MSRLLCFLFGHCWRVFREVRGRRPDAACTRCGGVSWDDYPEKVGLLLVLADLFIFVPLAIMGCALEQWRFYRRLRGGVWEQWYVEVCHADVWHRVPDDPEDRWPRKRPTPVCRGTPTVEDWR